ncbi:FAD-binding oxidoreductase [Leptospira interrogans]
MYLTGWGRYPTVDCAVHYPRSNDDVRHIVLSGPTIARGCGRAYGDSALNGASTLNMTRFNRMISFDETTGSLTAEAGVQLADIISAFLPRGWFPHVTPGTKYVSVGGLIAADVHGKNHHSKGSFGRYIDWIDVMIADGTIVRCSPQIEPELFGFTIGGMGLTGVILRAAFRLMPVESAWIRQQVKPAACLSEAIDHFERSLNSTYSVAWIDCLAKGRSLGRSLVVLGEHSLHSELFPEQQQNPFKTPPRSRTTVPFDMPSFSLNRYSVRAFNSLYYANARRSAREHIIDWDRFFYPLDSILDWNRIYGRRGFAQFQCVIPLATAERGIGTLLECISEAGHGSFLAVLKRMGRQDSHYSFPTEGYTLALDFPLRPGCFELMNKLDAITISHGGRFYLAKDSRMSARTLEQSDHRTASFREMRRMTGAGSRFISLQSTRLSL